VVLTARSSEKPAARAAPDLEQSLTDAIGGLLAKGQEHAAVLFNVGQEVVLFLIRFTFTFFITLMLSAFILADQERILGFFESLVPRAYRDVYRGALARIDRGLAGSDGAASGRLPLLASSFLPLTLLGEERRREETAGAFLELLPRARISIQHAAIATVHGVANRFPPAEAPRQRRSSRSGPGWKPTRPLRTGSRASSRPRTCCPRSTLAT